MPGRSAVPIVAVALALSAATGCSGGGDGNQRTLHLVDGSRHYTPRSATATCTVSDPQQWKVSSSTGTVLAHGKVNIHGQIQTIQGKPMCATVTTAHVHTEESYLISGCPTCGTTTVFDSNLDAQKGIVPLP